MRSVSVAHRIVTHLIRQRVLTADAVVTRGVAIQEISRRNRNFVVEERDGRSYFVKSGRVDGGLSSEARVYRRSSPALRRVLPRFFHYHAPSDTLVLEWLPHSQSLETVKVRGPADGTALGIALAAIHNEDSADRQRVQRPWIVTLSAPRIGMLRTISRANLDLLRIVQSSRPLCRAVEFVRDNWKASAFTHCDLRLSNCLRRGRKIYVVDWELSKWGDPSWDLAAVVADCLRLWVLSTGASTHWRGGRRDSKSTAMRRLRSFTRSFFDAYCDSRRVSTSERAVLLLRSIKFAAARLVQYTYEMQHDAVDLQPEAVLLLQLAANIATRPAIAAATFIAEANA